MRENVVINCLLVTLDTGYRSVHALRRLLGITRSVTQRGRVVRFLD
jgi:hypothetical protein